VRGGGGVGGREGGLSRRRFEGVWCGSSTGWVGGWGSVMIGDRSCWGFLWLFTASWWQQELGIVCFGSSMISLFALVLECHINDGG